MPKGFAQHPHKPSNINLATDLAPVLIGLFATELSQASVKRSDRPNTSPQIQKLSSKLSKHSSHYVHVFEVVARYLSFQQAAQGLEVTSTAVSHQIRVLEEDLGKSLFRRRPRPLTLTESGKILYPAVRDGLDAIASAITQLKYAPESTHLTVSVTPVWAAKWLVPRLPKFQQAYPSIDLRLQASNPVVDLRAQTVDLAIRYGRGDYPGLVVHKLMSDTFAPVCSPHLRNDKPPLENPEDLAHYPLLHFEWIHYGPAAPS